MMTCKEAARLISEQRDHPLPLRRRIGLRLHLAMCRMCTLYKKNLEIMGRISRRAGEFVMGDHTGAPCLSAETRQRIKRAISGSS